MADGRYIVHGGMVTRPFSNESIVTFASDGRVIPGEGLSPDEASQEFVRLVGAQIVDRIAELERENAELRAEAEAGVAVIEAELKGNAALRAWQERARPVVQAVATDAWYTLSSTLGGTLQQYACCTFSVCEHESGIHSTHIDHAPGCPVTHARALLAAERGEEAGE